MPQQFTTDSPTWAEIRAARKPRTDTVWVPMDGEVLEEIAQLEKLVVVAERMDETEHRTPEAPRLRSQLSELQEAAEAAAVPFTFTEINRRQYRALIEACPPTDPKWKWDEDKFAPLLIAASCSQPDLTTIPRADFVRLLAPGVNADDLAEHAGPAFEIWDGWSEAAAYVLYGTAYGVNAQATNIPFSVTATARTPASQPNSTSVSETDEA